MRRLYIYEHPDWPRLHWKNDSLIEMLAAVRYQQGNLIGQMEALGFDLRQEAVFETLTEDVLKTSDIEGERLDAEQVRSSVARHLGLDIGGLRHADRKVEGIKVRFWKRVADVPLNRRQRRVLDRLLGDFEAKLTTSKWAKLAKCSQDTALRDITDLVQRGLLVRNPGGGRSTSYGLVGPS